MHLKRAFSTAICCTALLLFSFWGFPKFKCLISECRYSEKTNIYNKNATELSLPDLPVLPKLLDGDVNMPDVMYQSVLILQKVYETKLVDLGSEMANCKHPTVCSAFDILTKAFGKRRLDLENYKYHLNILSQRKLAREPRPNSCNGCFAYNFNTIITPSNICRESENKIELLLLITTVPEATDARDALRETYLQFSEQNKGPIRHLFLIGGGWPDDVMMEVKQENDIFGDILVEDYKDSYFNLSYKVHGAFRWAVKHCSNARFISRSADDIYLNVPRILTYLNKHAGQLKNTVVGTCFSSEMVDRKDWTRHYQSKNDYTSTRFGPFCIGTTLIMSVESVMKIVKVGPDIPWFNLEDHWVGFAGEKANLKVKNVKGFNVEYYPHPNIELYFEWRKKKGVCSFDKNWFNLHRTTASDIRAVYRECVKKNLP